MGSPHGLPPRVVTRPVALQVLFSYLRHDDVTIPQRWGYDNIWWAASPCILGIVVGFLPACSAMIISRARAERRDALESDLHITVRNLRKKSDLSKPQKMHKGSGPNPASLNPIFDRV